MRELCVGEIGGCGMSDSVTKNGIAWKPCPFCGGEAILRSNYNSYFGYGIFMQCSICKSTGRIFNTGNIDKEKFDELVPKTKAAYKAVEAWNKRV